MTAQPVSILIAALGGEGGGVLADWIVAAARRAGLPVQATSVPGVAQRTGATSYYLECMPQPAPADTQPVFALMPVPGRVDVLLSSELLETARMIERGFASPDRTLVITARHRIYTTHEKMQMGDGRFDDAKLHQLISALSRRQITLDLRAIAQQHRTVISAVMFGALAASGALPWRRDDCEAAIRAGGIGVETSLAGFAAAFDAASTDTAAEHHTQTLAQLSEGQRESTVAIATEPTPTEAPSAPEDLGSIMALAKARLRDYQGEAYAERYRARVVSLIDAQGNKAQASDIPVQAVLAEAARQLALWMSYEDVIRVADLKTRASRLARIYEQAGAGPDDIVRIHEHLSPGIDEVAAIAPARLGRWLRARERRKHPVGARGKGITLQTTSLSGFALLRLLGTLRWLRPYSLRFQEEQAAIDHWLEALRFGISRNPDWALTLARLPQLRKGYSDTWERGVAAFERIFESQVQHLLRSGRAPDSADAQALEKARLAALADPTQTQLNRILDAPASSLPAGVHPVHWRPRQAVRPRPSHPL